MNIKDGIDLPTVTTKRWTGKVEETYTYRYLNAVPLKNGDNALLVNWCELTVSRPDGKEVYKNSFATNHLITHDTVAEIILAGRTRWKVENENNNTLFGQGLQPGTQFWTWQAVSRLVPCHSQHPVAVVPHVAGSAR